MIEDYICMYSFENKLRDSPSFNLKLFNGSVLDISLKVNTL